MKTVCFDLDGTLCTNTWGSYEAAEPFPWAIERVNRLAAAGHRIVVFTARGTATGIDWEPVTRAQLERWGVHYDDLKLGKPSADVYVDDRAVHTDAWRGDDFVRVPGLGLVAAREAEELPSVVTSHVSTVVESGRTFAGKVVGAEGHAQRLVARAQAVGIESDGSEIAAAIEDAVAPAVRAAGGDVVFSAALVAPPSAAHLDMSGLPRPSGPVVTCRALSEVAAGLRERLAPAGEGVAVAASTRAEAGAWPIALANDGTVADGLGGDLGVIVEGELIVAPGAELAERAGRDGVEIVEARPTLDQLLAAGEAFIAGLPFCVVPIGAVDGRPIARSAPGPIAARLLAGWGDEVGVDIAEQTKTLVGR